jgi:hypothetical protein
MIIHFYPFFPVIGIMHNITFAAIMAGPQITQVQTIIDAITAIQGYVLKIATALAGLMIVIAGVYIILDREMAVQKRGERLAFIRSVLIGYGIVLGANVLITIMTTVVNSVH